MTLNEQVLGQFSGTLMLLFGAVTLAAGDWLCQRFHPDAGSRHGAHA